MTKQIKSIPVMMSKN